MAQPAHELHMKGAPCTELWCTLQVPSETGVTTAYVKRYLIQLGMDTANQVKMETTGLTIVQQSSTMENVVIRFDPEGGWDVSSMSAIVVSDMLKSVISETAFDQIIIRSDGIATALIHKSCSEELFKFSGNAHVFVKPHVDEAAWKDMEILWLPATVMHGEALDLAAKHKEVLGLARKQGEAVRYGLRFAGLVPMKTIADKFRLGHTVDLGRFKVTAMMHGTGTSDLFAMMASIGWTLDSVEFIGDGHAMVSSKQCPKQNKLCLQRTDGSMVPMLIHASNAKARSLFKDQNMSNRQVDVEGEETQTSDVSMPAASLEARFKEAAAASTKRGEAQAALQAKAPKRDSSRTPKRPGAQEAHPGRTQNQGQGGQPTGVALFARKHMNLQAVPVGDSKVRQRLYESGRWTHGIIPFGNGRQVLHCMSIYGFPGSAGSPDIAEKNEAFLSDVVLSIQELGVEAPLFLFGDFNIDVSSSEVLSQAISGELLFDLGRDLGPTFLPSHGKPRRLDAILSTKTASTAIKGIDTLDSTGLPGHFRVLANVNILPFTDDILRIRRPAMFPKHIRFNESCLQHVLEKFPESTDSSVDSLYNNFSKCAELYLSLASGFTACKYSGRGTVPKLVRELRCCPQAPQGQGCESVPVRRAKRLLRRCEQLQYYLSNNDHYQVPQLWKGISSQSCFLFNFAGIIFASPTSAPEECELTASMKVLRDAIQAAQKSSVSKIVQAAREKIQQSWSSKPAAVYARVSLQ
eukprot:s395_g29.t1